MNYKPKHDRYHEFFESIILEQGYSYVNKKGYFNAHAHIDRANTFEFNGKRGVAGTNDISLVQKQNNTGQLHLSDYYSEKSLKQRMSDILEGSIYYGVTRLDSFIDTTADIGLKAFNVARELKEQYKDRIDFRIGSYPIFGWKDLKLLKGKQLEKAEFSESVFKEASTLADFIGGLPERDYHPHDRVHKDITTREDHVGYNVHVRRLIEASKCKKPIHIHVDQANVPYENGTERVLDVLDTYRDVLPLNINTEPSVWLIHMISPSCYSEKDFMKLTHRLVDNNRGLIVCPTAAISMRQLSKYDCRIHNSIARVPELMAAGVPVRIGTDNINDMYMPANSPDLYQEFFTLFNSVRYYNPNVMASLVGKLATGGRLNESERYDVFKSLNSNIRDLMRAEGFISKQ